MVTTRAGSLSCSAPRQASVIDLASSPPVEGSSALARGRIAKDLALIQDSGGGNGLGFTTTGACSAEFPRLHPPTTAAISNTPKNGRFMNRVTAFMRPPDSFEISNLKSEISNLRFQI